MSAARRSACADEVRWISGLPENRGGRANADEELLWPFLHILVAADDDDLDRWILQDFGTDRYLPPKGVVEVIL